AGVRTGPAGYASRSSRRGSAGGARVGRAWRTRRTALLDRARRTRLAESRLYARRATEHRAARRRHVVAGAQARRRLDRRQTTRGLGAPVADPGDGPGHAPLRALDRIVRGGSALVQVVKAMLAREDRANENHERPASCRAVRVGHHPAGRLRDEHAHEIGAAVDGRPAMGCAGTPRRGTGDAIRPLASHDTGQLLRRPAIGRWWRSAGSAEGTGGQGSVQHAPDPGPDDLPVRARVAGELATALDGGLRGRIAARQSQRRNVRQIGRDRDHAARFSAARLQVLRIADRPPVDTRGFQHAARPWIGAIPAGGLAAALGERAREGPYPLGAVWL